jgi:asparagine synthase (glutamine-hydrolysing)
MANGIESRVPFLENELFDFIATIPASVKFLSGEPKRLLKEAYRNDIPANIINRNDKMGFPVPIAKWLKTNKNVREFIFDIFNDKKAQQRFYLKKDAIQKMLNLDGSEYNRNLWGLLCLELWQRKFIDQ